MSAETINIFGNETIYVLCLEDILYIKGSGCYCHIYLISKQKEVLVTKTMKAIEFDLPKMEFFRCHHSYIINRNYIETIQVRKKNIILTKDIKIPISRRKYSSFRRFLISQE